MFLGQFVGKNATNEPRTLFERPNSDKIWKSGKYRNPRERREKWPFSSFILPKLGHFSRYRFYILCTYTPNRVLPHIFCFRKLVKFLLIFGEHFFIDYLPKYSEFSKNKIRYSSLIETFIFNFLWKTNRFYLPANPYFCLKPWKYDVALTSFMVDISYQTSFYFVRMCEIDGL